MDSLDDDNPKDFEPESLFVPKLHGIPWKALVQSLAFGTLVTVIWRKFSPTDPAGVWLGISSFLAAMMVLFVQPAVRSASIRIAFDEGGVRVKDGKTFVYWPFLRAARASLEDGGFASASVVVLDHPRPPKTLRVSIFSKMGKYESEDIVARYNRRSKSMHTDAPEGFDFDSLSRRERPLEAWCRDLSNRVKKSRDADYRQRSLEVDAVLRVFRDRRRSEELRAAAAYFLLELAAPELLDAVKMRLGSATPPLVLAMARLALEGEAIVASQHLSEALPYLQDVDRETIANLR